jgi:hypothetical protein
VGTLFEYALLRVVPRPERGECLNAGVVLYCPETGFLAARTRLDRARLLALCRDLDLDAVSVHLEAVHRACAGGPEAGPLGRLSPRERFGRITAPRSTVVQPSPVHTGLADDPEEELERLFGKLVARPEECAADEPC